jgi:hypothetical protein
MKKNLSRLMFAVAALIATQSATPVYASDVLSFDGGLFVIDEYSGSYNVINNSSDLYIFGFAVSNPNALTDNPGTTFTNWSGYSVSLALDGINTVPVNAYVTGDANLDDFNNPFLTTVNLNNYIAPGTSVSEFYFGSFAASDGGLLTVNSDGQESQFSSVTPLPSTWTMMLIGLAGLGFVAYRGTKNRSSAIAAA